MTFADPLVCLGCRGSIDHATSTCPHCGLNLRSPEIQNAWQALVVADQWVARAQEVGAGEMPEPIAATHEAAPRRSLSADTVLLVVGAASLLVAGLIFITVSWGSLGILGRALALLTFTAVVGALAHLVTRRSLGASAEALWTVFLGLLTLDWFAARDQGLLGLDALPGGHAAGIWGAVLLAVGVVIARAGRTPVGRTLVAPSMAAGAAPVIGAAGVAGELITDEFFWWSFATAVAAASVTLLHRRLALRTAAIVSGIALALLIMVAVIAALIEAIRHPAVGALVMQAHGLPLLVVGLSAAGVAKVIQQKTVRTVASTVASLSLAALLSIAAEEAWPERGALVVAAVVLVACAFGGARTFMWPPGLRWAAATVAAVAAIAALPWVARLMDAAGAGAFGPRSTALSATADADQWTHAGPWWVALIFFGGLAAGIHFARGWHVASQAERHLRAASASVIGLAAATSVAAAAPPVVSLGGSLVVIGGLLAFVNRAAPVGWRHLGSSVVATAPIATLSSWPASLVVWPLAVAVLALAEWHESDPVVRWAGRGFAAWWASLVPGVLAAQLGSDAQSMSLAIVGMAVAVMLAGALVLDRERSIAPTDVGAAAAGGLGLILSTFGGLTALPWTVAGAGMAAVGLLNRRRRWYRWAGAGLLGVAYVIRLANSGVEVVEAYTAPFAVVLLLVGWWTMRNPAVGTVRALAPGVALALFPSLPQALDAPTSLRALLLGLVALAFTAVGLMRGWKVPFVAGSGIVLVLVIANVGPWALGLPRWILFASLGVLAIGVGATWESRVRNGRAAASYVSAMR